MKDLLKQIIIILLFVFSNNLFLNAQEKDAANITFNGQVTTWGIIQNQHQERIQFGGRFVPTLLGEFTLLPTSKINFEASLNINGSANFTGLQYNSVDAKIKPYRVWIRKSDEHWEIRAGLQKINFGSAKMFRPLMWFDGMDVRDPLQLTDGVYGLLGKYFFQNNSNIWLWGLIGNINPKGYEMFGTAQWKPEIGGRYQIPAGPGEIAISANYRQINNSITLGGQTLNESKIGLDGKWDVGIGLWFESSATMTDMKNISSPFLPKVQDMWSFGADYTLPVANGLGITLEYFRFHVGDKFIFNGKSVDVIGTMLTYPLSVLDNFSGMVFYLPDQHKWMNYLSWGRMYDNLSVYAIAFWNPTNVQLMPSQSQNRNLFAGKGIEIMLNYNF